MRIRLKYLILLLSLIYLSCNAPDKRTEAVPRHEPYRAYNGKAVISEIAKISKIADEEIIPGGGNNGFVVIYFNFIPAVPYSGTKYSCAECSDTRIKLFYDNRESFHINWVKKWDISPGNEYPAIRHESLKKDNTLRVSYEVFLEPGK